MNLAYDLHLHSCLSPCASQDMTPRNVCRMAKLNGLDVIALTDHNTGGNLQAFQLTAMEHDLLFLPGMELCTREEVHILAYFPSLEAALKADAQLPALRGNIRNKADYFGHQTLVDSQDEVVGEEEAFLLGALDMNLEDTLKWVRSFRGVPVPAHIHRSFGLVKVLGFIPERAALNTVEVGMGEGQQDERLVLHSSDAHELGLISQRQHFLQADRDLKSILNSLQSGKPV